MKFYIPASTLHLLLLLDIKRTNAFTQPQRIVRSSSRLQLSFPTKFDVNWNTEVLNPVNDVLHQVDTMTDDLVRNIVQQITQSSVLLDIQSQILKFGPVVENWLNQHPEVVDALKQIQVQVNELPAPVSILGSAIITYVVVSSSLNSISQGELYSKC